jgi:hypothetical protein
MVIKSKDTSRHGQPPKSQPEHKMTFWQVDFLVSLPCQITFLIVAKNDLKITRRSLWMPTAGDTLSGHIFLFRAKQSYRALCWILSIRQLAILSTKKTYFAWSKLNQASCYPNYSAHAPWFKEILVCHHKNCFTRKPSTPFRYLSKCKMLWQYSKLQLDKNVIGHGIMKLKINLQNTQTLQIN